MNQLNDVIYACLFADLFRRPVSMEERNYLREINVVSEIQCDLGMPIHDVFLYSETDACLINT